MDDNGGDGSQTGDLARTFNNKRPDKNINIFVKIPTANEDVNPAAIYRAPDHRKYSLGQPSVICDRYRCLPEKSTTCLSNLD